jgi:hypothetical protein
MEMSEQGWTQEQLRAAATLLLADGLWVKQRWVAQNMPGTHDSRWATLKRMVGDGTLERQFDPYGLPIVRLAPK